MSCMCYHCVCLKWTVSGVCVFIFSLLWTTSLRLSPTDTEYLSLRTELSQKKNFTSALLGATSPFVHTTTFPAISEAWIKYVKITVFWDVLPPSSHYKMPLPPWRWRQQIPQKPQYHFTKLNGVTYGGTVISVFGDVRAQMSCFLNYLQSPCPVSHFFQSLSSELVLLSPLKCTFYLDVQVSTFSSTAILSLGCFPLY